MMSCSLCVFQDPVNYIDQILKWKYKYLDFRDETAYYTSTWIINHFGRLQPEYFITKKFTKGIAFRDLIGILYPFVKLRL